MNKQDTISIIGVLKACRRHMMYPDANPLDKAGAPLCRTGCGVCFTVRTQLTAMEYKAFFILSRQYVRDWVYFSGSDMYPIPPHSTSTGEKAAQQAYQNYPLWKTAQGAICCKRYTHYIQMRGAYLDFLINKFSNLRETLS